MYGHYDDNDHQYVYDSDLYVYHADIFGVWIIEYLSFEAEFSVAETLLFLMDVGWGRRW